MSRSGYIDDFEDHRMVALWRGQVASAIRGKRGQGLLRELLEALDAMPEKRLVAHDLRANAPAFIPPEFASPAVCALGSLGAKRGIALETLDPEDYDQIADTFGVAHPLIQEIEYMNDEAWFGHGRETPEHRWQRMRDWVASNIKA